MENVFWVNAIVLQDGPEAVVALVHAPAQDRLELLLLRAWSRNPDALKAGEKVPYTQGCRVFRYFVVYIFRVL